jgi:hypothetical protein
MDSILPIYPKHLSSNMLLHVVEQQMTQLQFIQAGIQRQPI